MTKQAAQTNTDIEIRYRDPLARLKSTFPDEPRDRFEVLRLVILRECANCERYLADYPDGIDETESWRREQNAGRREVQKQRIAVEKLARFAATHKLQTGIALAQAGFGGFARDGEKIELADAFARALRAYENTLSKTIWMPEVFEQATQYYNLMMPISSKRRPVNLRPSTGLMLRLIMIFRKFTSGNAAFGRSQMGEKLPTVGLPHYDLAADFARIATGEDIADPEKRIMEFVANNPGVGLYQWPRRMPEKA